MRNHKFRKCNAYLEYLAQQALSQENDANEQDTSLEQNTSLDSSELTQNLPTAPVCIVPLPVEDVHTLMDQSNEDIKHITDNSN